MMGQEEITKENKVNLLNFVDKKVKILIIIFIVYGGYLISTIQLTPNTHNICNLQPVNRTCNGNMSIINNEQQCCVKGIIYTENDLVPKKSINYYQGMILLGLFLAIIYMLIKNLAHPDFLNYKWAKRILEEHFKTLYPDYQVKVGPVAKLRSHYETRQPIKWVTGVLATKDNEDFYFQGEVESHWRSTKLEDHIIAIKKRDEPLTASIIDREETADIVFITSFDLVKSKKILTQMGKGKNLPP